MAVREIGTDIKLTGEKEFNDGMKSINSNLKVLKSDMAAVSATFEDNANSVEALNAKNKVLKDIYDQQRVKVDALQQMYGKVAEKYGENSAQADKYKTQLNQATVAMVKAEKELRKNAEALDEATSSAKPAEKAAEDVADANKKVAKSSGDAAEKVTLLSKAGTAAKSALSGMGSVAGGTVKVMGAMTAASATALAGLAAVGTAGLSMVAGFAKESAAAAASQAEDAYAKLAAAEEALSKARTRAEKAEAENAKAEAEALLASVDKTWLEFAGRIDQLDEAASRAKRALGGVLLPQLRTLSIDGSALLNNFAQSMEEAGGDTEKQGEVIAEYIVKAAQLIKQKLPEYIALGKELFAAIGEGLSDYDDELFEMAEDLVFDLLDGIIAFAPELGQAAISLIEKLMNGLIERGPDLVTSAVSMVSQLVSGLAQAAPDLIPAAGRLIGELLIALIHSAPQLLEAGLELVYGIVAGLIGGVGEILSAVDVLVEELITFFSESDSEFLQAGADILTAIKEGISRGWEALKTWFKNLWNSLFGDLDVEVGVSGTQSSPQGSRSLPELVTSATKNMTQDPQYPAWPNSPRGGSAGCGNIINLYFYAKTITQSDIDMVIDKVNEALGDEL